MQSHALSSGLLTLTGRLSLYRGVRVVTEEFIRLVEADYLDHWLWGRFRFLSGDDKSTAYATYRRRGRKTLLYVPDAMACTVEHVEGNGALRGAQNVFRWAGNTLRNGTRMIALGPRRVPPFVWWCMVDQRLSMWTSMAGPVGTVLLSVFVSPWWLWVSLIWVTGTRLALSLPLFWVRRRVSLSFVWLLFANQLLVSATKIYMLFHLPRQRWSNRGYALAGGVGVLARVRGAGSLALTLLWVAVLVLGVAMMTGVVDTPDAAELRFALGRLLGRIGSAAT